MTTHAPNAMVVSVDHLASAAGVHMLRGGGSAADAAVAANAVLAVTSPHMCGMGGDLFALVYEAGHDRPLALNASGRAGAGADAAALRAEGFDAVPPRGDLRAAPVPGCVDGWLALHERCGRLPLADVLAPAIGYASNGFPASPLLAWASALLDAVPGCGELAGIRGPGQRVRRPGVAAALASIVRGGRAGFYQGAFGEGLVRLGAGVYTDADLSASLADWVDPIFVDVWGHRLWTIPPNSQGYLTLLGAAIAEGLPLPDATDDALWAHLLVEAARAAAQDRIAFLYEHADPMPLLHPAAVDARRRAIDPGRRAEWRPVAAAGDTTYLCAVDGDGMGVSLIQSNASGFGCLVFEPTTEIGLHNRGIGFSLLADHPAELGPGRRPPHTLSPALVTRPDGTLRATIGTMGGDAQPQVLLQLLTRLLHHGESAGAVIRAPRWALGVDTGAGFGTWEDPDGGYVDVEDPAWADGLRERGHRVNVVTHLVTTFGHAHVIDVGPDGMLGAEADPRAMTGAACGY